MTLLAHAPARAIRRAAKAGPGSRRSRVRGLRLIVVPTVLPAGVDHHGEQNDIDGEQASDEGRTTRFQRGRFPGSGSTTGLCRWPNSLEPTRTSARPSLSLVRARLAGRAAHHGLTDIDAAAIRLTAPRGSTQEGSRLIYECRTAGAEPLAGIRYHSRLDDGTSNRAVFEAASDSPEPLHVVDAE